MIISQVNTENQINEFIKLPVEIYKNYKNRALTSEKDMKHILNSAIKSDSKSTISFLGIENDKTICRIMLTNIDEKIKSANFSFFECLPGYNNSAHQLITFCEHHLKKHNIETITGPVYNTLSCGLLTTGFDYQQTIFTNYNPPWYEEIFKNNSYISIKTLNSYLLDKSSNFPMDFKPDNIKTRCLNIKNMNEEFSRFQKLQNAIFSGRSMTSEINATNNTGFIEKLFPLIDEDLIIIAESPDNEPIGVLICLPDHYQLNFENRITRARLISIGVIKKWQKQGTGLAMIQHLTQNLIMKNYLQLEASYILQNNLPPQELLKKFHGKLIKTHVIYKKILI